MAMAKVRRARRPLLLPGLPDEIVVWEILVHLPPKSLLRCRAVYRALRWVTSTRQFLLAHHSHQPSLPIFYGSEYRSTFNHQDILAFDHQAADELHTVAKFFKGFYLEASCDGLLVVSECGITGTFFYVSNLATRQDAPIGLFMDVKILGMYPHHPTSGYRLLLHRRSNHRWMHKTLLPEGQIGCYVLSLGSKQAPRYIGWPEPASPGFNAPALVRGNLHWYSVHYHREDHSMEDQNESKHVIVFDTIAESFRKMCAPVDSTNSYISHMDGTAPSDSCIFEMDGALGICAHNTTTGIVNIWILQDYEREVWDLKYRIKLPVAEIREQFQGCDDHWYVKVVSVDREILLLVSFG